MQPSSGIKVIDIMTGEVIIARPEMTITEIAKLMNSFRIGGSPVVEHGKVIGMITERDIMTKVVAANQQPSQINVGQVMTAPPKVIATIDEDMDSVAAKMAKFDVTRIPVVDDEHNLMGIVTNRDVLKNSKELINVLVEQARVKAETWGDHTAFGKCELCGESTHLVFKKNQFVCDSCTKKSKRRFGIF